MTRESIVMIGLCPQMLAHILKANVSFCALKTALEVFVVSYALAGCKNVRSSKRTSSKWLKGEKVDQLPFVPAAKRTKSSLFLSLRLPVPFPLPSTVHLHLKRTLLVNLVNKRTSFFPIKT